MYCLCGAFGRRCFSKRCSVSAAGLQEAVHELQPHRHLADCELPGEHDGLRADPLLALEASEGELLILIRGPKTAATSTCEPPGLIYDRNENFLSLGRVSPMCSRLLSVFSVSEFGVILDRVSSTPGSY